MTAKLLIATNNPNKLAEFQEILADFPLWLTNLAAEAITLDPEETGKTFEDNAILKANVFALASGLPVLADDSGLEVDALNGEPGVFSARYGNTAKDDHIGRYQMVLAKLAAQNLPWEGRTARFKCVIAVATPAKLIGTVEGTIEGFINYEAKGSNGFGYDPIFYVPQFGKNLAEVSSDQKHSISHRGQAGRAAIPLIRQLIL